MKSKIQRNSDDCAGTEAMKLIFEPLLSLCLKYPDLEFTFVFITDAFQFQTGDAGLVSSLFFDLNIAQHHLSNGDLRFYASPYYLKNILY